jgi:hypothetical protein
VENQAIEPKILMVLGALAVDNEKAVITPVWRRDGAEGRLAALNLSFGKYNGK